MYPNALLSASHGVKGEEYDNVVFVISKGWNQYRFEKYAPMIFVPASIPKDMLNEVERNLKVGKTMKHKIIFLVIVVVIVLVMMYLLSPNEAVCPICGKNHVVHSCIKPIGLSKENVLYNDLINTFGRPENVEFVHNSKNSHMYVQYNNLAFKFETTSPTEEDQYSQNWRLFMISTTDDKYLFGEKIHVGCTKSQIQWIFRNAMPVKEKERGTEYWDHTELWTISFEYDSNNRVSNITFNF